MDRFRDLWSLMDRSSDSASIPTALDEPITDVPGRGSSGDALRGRLLSHRRSRPPPQSQSQPRQNTPQSRSSDQRRGGLSRYSAYSTQGPFQTRMFFSENFMLGAGAVIIQPSSGKVVIVQDGNSWFLPKGRKDLGESIEQAALREAYEESGYRCEFLPLYHWTNAPVHSRLVYGQKHTEPLHVTITSYAARRNRPPGEYLTFWYACQIGPGAVRELGTGMPDEVGYIGHLVTYEVANRMLGEVERTVLTAARNEWIRSIEIDEQIRTTEAQREGTIEFE